ncbi:hypothetical protein [Nocardioides jishulii]|uniref:Uncharacterized protein n=1 Tax=Nocardioides jishulii TaxID=2575440 RepID=A0A4U2YQU5_9ACTN|nr:hypothetical protein [Nocardioides jishulii]QCX26389.1 hypothetical protein FCL41_01645 [Nocardioides jishulii]TKI63806.1 hypothetical protein FC770_01060 [Nocardioides jishulii]
MTITVDLDSIRRRHQERTRRQSFAGIDLWVHLDGVDRHEARTAVLDAVTPLPGGADDDLEVLPTSGGTYLWLPVGDNWTKDVETLAANLTAAGFTGEISPAPVSTSVQLMSRAFAPTAFLAFTLDPPIEDGPFALHRPVRRWGVTDVAQAAFLAEATSWVTRAGMHTWAGHTLMVPVTAEDSAEVLPHLLDARESVPVIELAGLPAPGEEGRELMRRTLTLDLFGQSAWSNADPEISTAQGVHELVQLIIRLAPHLDVAVLGAARPATTEFHDLQTPAYGLVRHLWHSYVPDAAPVLLLTDRHMERVGDLSAWQVQEVAPGRHLLQWHRLDDWFTPPTETGHVDPDADALARARHDLRDLFVTRAVRKANPLRQRS